MLKHLPNLLSLSRIPLACALFFVTGFDRFWILFIAMITDGLDGYLARKLNAKSYLGTLIDPFTDKFFIGITLFIFFDEGILTPFQVISLLARDIAVFLFGLLLLLQKSLFIYPIKAIYSGKVTTALQFFTLISLFFGLAPPPPLYLLFIGLGVLSFIELLIPFLNKKTINS